MFYQSRANPLPSSPLPPFHFLFLRDLANALLPLCSSFFISFLSLYANPSWQAPATWPHLPSPPLYPIPLLSRPLSHACFFRYNSSLLFPLSLAPVRDAPSTLFALSLSLSRSLSRSLAPPPCNLSLSLPTPGQSNTRLDPLFVALTARNQYIPLSAVPSIRDHRAIPRRELLLILALHREFLPPIFFLSSLSLSFFFLETFVFDLVFFLWFFLFLSFLSYYSPFLVWAVSFSTIPRSQLIQHSLVGKRRAQAP